MNELINYIKNPRGDIENFNLAVWYENQNQLSPACSFYLRSSEFTENKNLAYECLLRLYLCYLKLTNRDYTCEILLKSAISLCPNKPEAYFLLSQFYEIKKNWTDSYLYSSIGLENPNPTKLFSDVGYHDEYMLIFQKAVSSWWFGKPNESRSLFQKLKNEYKERLNEYYFQKIEQNITSLGSGPEDVSCVRYNKSKYDKIKIKFKDLENVEKNFSQTYQDIFVLTSLDGKKQGTYLEIGASYPFHNNNTALLEQFEWKGIAIELKQEIADIYKKERKNTIICEDALKINYNKLLDENYQDSIIDYLQLDIEPAKNTFEALLSIPFEKYQFRVITYEHDHYVDMTGNYREKSRRYLIALGYTLLFRDISPNENSPFEDWWIKKELINPEILIKLNSIPTYNINQVEKLLLN